MIASSSVGGAGFGDVTKQLPDLVPHSEFALTPALATATASFMAFTSQNNAVCVHSMAADPNLAELTAAIHGSALQNSELAHLAVGNASLNHMQQHHKASHLMNATGARAAPPNNNGGTVLINSNLMRRWCIRTPTSHFFSCFPFYAFVEMLLG
ncbi:unnamed protein product [Dicrocoelium dendriticum]|nr:unnamed protein product [Dicrocoelium dendriticum]